MIMKNWAFAIGVGLTLASGHLSALNVNFLNKTVLSALQEKDIEPFRIHARKTVTHNADNESASWQSPSGIKTIITPMLTYNFKNQPCRIVRLALKDERKRVESYKVDICKDPKTDRWNIAETPAGNYTPQDWDMVSKEIVYALEHSRDGSPSSWRNPVTGTGGTVVPLGNEKLASYQACRHAAISIYDKEGRASDGNYLFCKTAEKPWERVTQPEQ